MKRYLRNIIFLIATIVFYFLWNNGGEPVYGKIIAIGVEKITSMFSNIETVTVNHLKDLGMTMLYFKYPDRTTSIAMEYCLPVVLLLAWHFALFFDHRIKAKTALKLMAINMAILFILQVFFPMLLFNISQSKVKSTGLFIGLQIFSFLVFFLILKDSLLIKHKYTSNKEGPSR
jgi:hypothetical protein